MQAIDILNDDEYKRFEKIKERKFKEALELDILDVAFEVSKLQNENKQEKKN